MTQDQAAPAVVSLRERVKSPPAQTMINSYYAPAVAAGIRFQFDPEMKIHVAHALMLAERKIVDRSEIAQILATLLELRQSGVSALTIDYEQEDLYSYIERFLVERLGPATGGRLHTGRSRNDMHTTSWRLALRARLLDLLKTVLRLRRTLLDLAEMHIDTVMPGYTTRSTRSPSLSATTCFPPLTSSNATSEGSPVRFPAATEARSDRARSLPQASPSIGR